MNRARRRLAKRRRRARPDRVAARRNGRVREYYRQERARERRTGGLSRIEVRNGALVYRFINPRIQPGERLKLSKKDVRRIWTKEARRLARQPGGIDGVRFLCVVAV